MHLHLQHILADQKFHFAAQQPCKDSRRKDQNSKFKLKFLLNSPNGKVENLLDKFVISQRLWICLQLYVCILIKLKTKIIYHMYYCNLRLGMWFSNGVLAYYVQGFGFDPYNQKRKIKDLILLLKGISFTIIKNQNPCTNIKEQKNLRWITSNSKSTRYHSLPSSKGPHNLPPLPSGSFSLSPPGSSKAHWSILARWMETLPLFN